MTRGQLTEKLLDIKRERGWAWRYITEAIGGLSPVLIVAACMGQMRLPAAQAARARELFGLTEAEARLLGEAPMRGMPMPPTDPLIYRFYELVMVYGSTWKELIQEEFGDGIMSAIDFDMQLERRADPKGDRVQVTMHGKFLPYRYYGAQQGTPEFGYREE
jgi:cyanate lyase